MLVLLFFAALVLSLYRESLEVFHVKKKVAVLYTEQPWQKTTQQPLSCELRGTRAGKRGGYSIKPSAMLHILHASLTFRLLKLK